MEYIAHLKYNEATQNWVFQSLEDHLQGTAKLSGSFAAEWNDGELGFLEGLIHDIGKYSVDFQKYIRYEKSGYSTEYAAKPDHSSAGAIYAAEAISNLLPGNFSRIVSYQIAGHHAGLLNWYKESSDSGSLKERLAKTDLLNQIRPLLPEKPDLPKQIRGFCGGKLTNLDDLHVWIRMMFSCLVDADFLDTETFMQPEKAQKRQDKHEDKQDYNLGKPQLGDSGDRN